MVTDEQDPMTAVRKLVAMGFRFHNLGDPQAPTVIFCSRNTRSFVDMVKIHSHEEAEATRFADGKTQKEVGGHPVDVVNEVVEWPAEGLVPSEGF